MDPHYPRPSPHSNPLKQKHDISTLNFSSCDDITGSYWLGLNAKRKTCLSEFYNTIIFKNIIILNSWILESHLWSGLFIHKNFNYKGELKRFLLFLSGSKILSQVHTLTGLEPGSQIQVFYQNFFVQILNFGIKIIFKSGTVRVS